MTHQHIINALILHQQDWFLMIYSIISRWKHKNPDYIYDKSTTYSKNVSQEKFLVRDCSIARSAAPLPIASCSPPFLQHRNGFSNRFCSSPSTRLPRRRRWHWQCSCRFPNFLASSLYFIYHSILFSFDSIAFLGLNWDALEICVCCIVCVFALKDQLIVYLCSMYIEL